MPFLSKSVLDSILKHYDQRRGFFSRIFGDHPTIEVLRLAPADYNIFEIYQCFVENLPKESDAAHFVYRKLFGIKKNENSSQLTQALDLLIQAKLTTQTISNLFDLNFKDYIFPSLKLLQDSTLLTEKNLNDMAGIKNRLALFLTLYLLSNSNIDQLTQAMFDSIKVNPNLSSIFRMLNSPLRTGLMNSQNLERILQLPKNNFLFTFACYEKVWWPLRHYRLTQAIFEQLISFSQRANPEQQINQYVNNLLANHYPLINDDQNTHHASIHRSVADSASKLFAQYGPMIEGEGDLQNILEWIQGYLMQLPKNDKKNAAAQRYIASVINRNFTDEEEPNLIISKLLAVCFLAVHDRGQRMGTLPDARAQFLEGLYEIQRGYNLSEGGHDQGGPDDPMCSGGTFNKLIEKLQGIHPDVKVLYITPAVASLKLAIVVREVALDYLSRLAEPHTLEGFQRFVQLIAQIRQDECVDSIWNQIKTKVIDRMFDEFGSLYLGKTDVKLINLIEGGQYLKLEGLSRFQEQIFTSSGYKHYCSQSLRYSSNFFLQPSAPDGDSSCNSRFSLAMSRKAGS